MREMAFNWEYYVILRPSKSYGYYLIYEQHETSSNLYHYRVHCIIIVTAVHMACTFIHCKQFDQLTVFGGAFFASMLEERGESLHIYGLSYPTKFLQIVL